MQDRSDSPRSCTTKWAWQRARRRLAAQTQHSAWFLVLQLRTPDVSRSPTRLSTGDEAASSAQLS